MTNVNWDKTGIPSTTVDGDIMTGQGTGSTINEIQSFVGDLGPGPQTAAVDGAYAFAGPDAVVQKKNTFEPIEAVEGFGQQDVGQKIVAGTNVDTQT